MSTQSIMKNIEIHEPFAAKMLIDALEKAANAAETSLPVNLKSEDLSKDELKKYFGEN